MVKSREEVIAQFHEQVNMTADELQAWLDDPKSTKAGTGVGIQSGHKIIEILKKNPDKDPEKYDEDDIEHMRKVVAYNSRHLAQEDHLKDTKSKEELENTKSTISLKNWGHDPIKTLDQDGAAVTNEHAEKPEPAEDDTDTNTRETDKDVSTASPTKNTKRKHPERNTDGAEEQSQGGDTVSNVDPRDGEDGVTNPDGHEEHVRKKSKTTDITAESQKDVDEAEVEA